LNPQINFKLDVDVIIKKLTLDQNSLKLNQLRMINDLPFVTSTAKTDATEISSIEAAVFRDVLGISKSKMTDTNEILKGMLKQVKTENPSLLEYMLTMVYIENGSFKKFHPRMYTFGGSESSGIKNLAKYIVAVLMTPELVDALDVMMKSNPNSVIEELILSVIPYEKDSQKKVIVDRTTLLPEVQKNFSKDFLFLCSNENLFINNIDKLLSYYLFFYISQVILKLRQGFDGDETTVPVYYFLDWEKISRSRISYEQGWRMIQKKSENIFAYTNLLQILNCTIDGAGIGSFQDIYGLLESLSNEEIDLFENDINIINGRIMSALNLDHHMSSHKNIFGKYDYLDTLLQTIIESKETRKAAFDRYEKRIKDIADVGFLKPRGQLGSTLNLKQDWIIFLTRICIGHEEKIRLNDLWSKLKKRGINFDQFSKEIIVEYFEKINILEKKSDSGDAQYVRVL